MRKLLPPSPRPSRRLEDADRSLSRLGLKSAAAAELVLATVAREGAGSEGAPRRSIHFFVDGVQGEGAGRREGGVNNNSKGE